MKIALIAIVTALMGAGAMHYADTRPRTDTDSVLVFIHLPDGGAEAVIAPAKDLEHGFGHIFLDRAGVQATREKLNREWRN